MFDNWLSRLIKITTLISIISMIIGAIIIHNHLNTIGFNGLFSDTISTSAVLVPILICIMIVITCICVVPFLSFPMIYQEYKSANNSILRDSDSYISKRKYAIKCSFFLYSLMLLILFCTAIYLSLPFAVLILFVTPFLAFLLFKKIINGCFLSSLDKKDFGNMLLVVMCHLFFVFSIVWFYLIGYAWFAKSCFFYITVSCLYIVNSMILLNSVYKNKTDIPTKLYYILSLSISLVFGLLFTTMEHSTFVNYILVSLGYIEDENKSKLYVVNDNVFALDKEKDNNLLLSVIRNHFLYIKPNVYYGYMAWNVGEIKVFCPHDTNKEYYK